MKFKEDELEKKSFVVSSDQNPADSGSGTSQTGQGRGKSVSRDGEQPRRIANRYEVLSLLGKGGMGAVYKARHEELGKIVAIKMLQGAGANDERANARFRQEARACSQLKHQNLVTVSDFGITENGEPYLVMDFIEGKSLSADVKENGKLDPARAIPIFEQVCAALGYIHWSNIIHRDLKPSNIMLSSSASTTDYVTIVDFGIAKSLSDGSEHELTKTGETFGSPHYMSPEQCLGQQLDLRSDIYSLGCLMYEALVGAPPFHGKEALSILYMHINKPATFPDKCDVPEQLQKLILRCLEKSPADRIQSAEEVARALAEIKAGRKPQIKGAPLRFEATPKQLAIIAALVVTLIGGSLFAMNKPPPSPVVAPPAPTASAAKPVDGRSVKELFLEGQKLKTVGKLSEALVLFEKVVELDPDHLPALVELAEGHYSLAHWHESADYYGRLIKLEPDNFAYYLMRSEAYFHGNQFKPAYTDALKASELAPANGRVWETVAQGQMVNGLHEEALKSLQKTVELGAAGTATYSAIGTQYVRLHRLQDAVGQFDKAIELAPDNANAYDQRARCFKELGNYQKAVDDFTKALDIEKSKERLILRASCYEKLGKTAKAKADLDAAAKL